MRFINKVYFVLNSWHEVFLQEMEKIRRLILALSSKYQHSSQVAVMHSCYSVIYLSFQSACTGLVSEAK